MTPATYRTEFDTSETVVDFSEGWRSSDISALSEAVCYFYLRPSTKLCGSSTYRPSEL